MTLKLAGLVLLLAFGCGDVPDRPTVELERGFLGEVTFGGTVDFPVRSKRCREANLTTRTIGEAAGTDWCESTLKRIGNAEGASARGESNGCSDDDCVRSVDSAAGAAAIFG